MGLIHKELDSGAVFSTCRTWRYTLYRIWDDTKPKLIVIGLNPSTADERKNDPTINRCISFAKDMGLGGYIMLNLFAYRATDPKKMKAAQDPVGELNDKWILRITTKLEPDSIIVAAWGTHGSFLNRANEVMRILEQAKVKVHCFGVTKDGQPRHPLYLKSSCRPIRYRGQEIDV